jgi:hypothetical protein
MKALFVAYQDPRTRQWAPVGKLTRTAEGYRFAYTNGAKQFSEFVPFGRMTDVCSTYHSTELFPLFSNRILPKNRPEYREYLGWLGLSDTAHDELEELSRTGGLRVTDSLELIPCPERTAIGTYEAYFFCRGIRHATPEARARADELSAGERLFLMRDLQNQHDPAALAIRTKDPVSVIGYTPRYFAKDFAALLNASVSDEVRVTVEQANLTAPAQYRLLCRITAPWPATFSPCDDVAFQEISSSF